MQLMQVCQNEEVKSIFKCAGSENSVSLAISVAARGAEVLLLGLSEKPATLKSMELSKKGIRINPSLIYDHPSDYKNTIKLIRTGKIHPGFIVTRYYMLSEVQKALEEASSGLQSKIVIRIQ